MGQGGQSRISTHKMEIQLPHTSTHTHLMNEGRSQMSHVSKFKPVSTPYLHRYVTRTRTRWVPSLGLKGADCKNV